jgi:two-component system sensor histidine kinase BaeS
MSDLGALNYQKDEIELVEFLDDELTKAATLLPAELKLNWQPEHFTETYMLGDTQRLGQLVKNLMQNSVRYTDAPGEITVSIEQRHTRVKLIWEDTSPGVSTDECDRLVEPLYRAEASRSRKVGGSGLGLAIAQAIVHAHGAKMKASPSNKGGLRWEIAFPKVKHR